MLLGSQGTRYKCDVLDYRRRVFKDLTVGVHAGWELHCLSHSRRQRTKPELGFMHGRRWRTNVTAESNDMPRLRIRYAITIAAERETPC